MRSIPVWGFLSLILFSILSITPAAAATVTISPDTVSSGGQVTVAISGLSNGQTFALNIDGTYAITPGSYPADSMTTIFATNSFSMPFSLTSGSVSASSRGTTYSEFSIKPTGGKTYTIGATDSDDGSTDGYITLSEAQSVSAGTYDWIRMTGAIDPSVSRLTTQVNLFGTVQGTTPNPTINFNIGGLSDGLVQVVVVIDGSPVASRTITVGNGVPVATTTTTAAPTATETTTTTTITTTTTTTTTTGTGTTTGTTTAATTTATTAVQYSPTSGKITSVPTAAFSSADRKVRLTGQGIESATVMMVGSGTVPENWLMVSKAYAVLPDTLTFSPAATLSFDTSSYSSDYAFFIARKGSTEWSAVPCSAGDSSIYAEIGNAGTYALMAYRPESTITSAAPTATGDQPIITTPTPLVKSTAKPKVASIAGGTVAATKTASSGSSGLPLPVELPVIAGAVALGAVLFGVMRKE